MVDCERDLNPTAANKLGRDDTASRTSEVFARGANDALSQVLDL